MDGRFQRTMALVLCALFFAMPKFTLTMAAEPVRLAILGEQTAVAPVADLLTLALSTNRQVRLVERDQLDKVFREQATASASGKSLIRLGQVVGADGLLVIQRVTRVEREVLTLRLIAVRPGVTLAVEVAPWPLDKAIEWSQRVVPRLSALLPKLQVSLNEAVPLSVLNLRSAVRSREHEALERELTLLLILRLAKERDIFVLERQHLRAALFEKELTAEESQFWTGRYLLDGMLDKNRFDPERVTISARLSSSRIEAPLTIEVTGARTDLSKLAEELSAKVLEALHRNPSELAWKPAQEAQQFLDEANWAFRWALWPEAQEASESAWALGFQGLEVASLRIRAYGEEVMGIYRQMENLMVPAVPEAARLRAARRSVELFCEAAPLVFSNAPTTNFHWFELGVDTLLRAASLLDGFYNAAELRLGNEEALASLREATRKLVPVLDVSQPPRNLWEQSSQKFRWKAVTEKLGRIKWFQGGVWFDRPEDSLPMFRQMLGSGSQQKGLPRVVAWTWPERKRIPEIMRQFIANLCCDTNPGVRLEGRYLAVVREPFDSAGRFRERETELLSAIWEERARLWADPTAVTVVPRAGEVLRNKHRFISHTFFDREPWRTFIHNLRKDYLQSAPTWDEEVFRALLPGEALEYSAAEAAELAPLIGVCKARLKPKGLAGQPLDGAAHVLSGLIGLTNASPIARRQPKQMDFLELFPGLRGNPDDLLRVSFRPWPTLNRGLGESSQPSVTRLIFRQGKLWAMIQFITEENRFLKNCPTSYVAVDPVTGSCEEIRFPLELGFPDEHFEVTGDALFVSLRDHLQRYSFQTRTWIKLVAPIEGGASITSIGNTLFLASHDSLLKLDPKSSVLQVLASSRQRPAESTLDERWKPGARVFAWPGGTPGVLLGRTDVFSLEPSSGTWAQASLPESAKRYRTASFISSEGVEVMLTSSECRRVLAFRNHGENLISLLETPGYFPVAKSSPEPAFPQAQWDWPEPFDIEYPCLLAHPAGLWAWQPRLPAKWFTKPEEPVIFQDKRNATLLCFEFDQRQALPVAVCFELDGQAFDPFDPKQNSGKRWYGPEPPTPHYLSTPEGLVLACSGTIAGHWMISKSELDRRLKVIRERLGTSKGGKQ